MAGRLPRALLPRTPLLAALTLGAAVFLAWLPSITGEFVYDDVRFVSENPAVRELGPRNLVRYFTDPSTMAASSWRGIYRPLRTLDFAIDWAVSGGAPWFFHVRNLLYHALAAWLVFLLLARLRPEEGEPVPAAAFLGALLFAVHPVQTESVAWITSRGDLLVGVLFLAALLLHLRDRFVAAAVVLVAALFAKESAAVFAGAAVLVDRFLRRRFAWRAYAVYGVLAGLYALLWVKMIAGGSVDGVRHVETFWGGTWGTNLLTMAKGFLHYARVIVFPVHFTVDFHVPVATGLDARSAGALAALLVVLVAVGVTRRGRFALAWFFLTILPVSNLLFPIGIPTAERFLYLPLVGIALLAAPWLARTRLAFVVLGAFVVLSMVQGSYWRTPERLFDHAMDVGDTPRALGHMVDRELKAAYAAQARLPGALASERSRIHAEMTDHAAQAVVFANRLVRLYREDLRFPPEKLPLSAAKALSQQSNAFLLLERWGAALAAADLAIKAWARLPEAFYNAAYASMRLGDRPQAIANFRRSAELSLEAARELETAGQADAARAARQDAGRAREAAEILSRER